MRGIDVEFYGGPWDGQVVKLIEPVPPRLRTVDHGGVHHEYHWDPEQKRYAYAGAVPGAPHPPTEPFRR